MYDDFSGVFKTDLIIGIHKKVNFLLSCIQYILFDFKSQLIIYPIFYRIKIIYFYQLIILFLRFYPLFFFIDSKIFFFSNSVTLSPPGPPGSVASIINLFNSPSKILNLTNILETSLMSSLSNLFFS